MKPARLLGVIGIIASCALAFLLFRSRQEIATVQSKLAAAQSATNDLTTALTELRSRALSDTDLARMEADRREAIKLRGEVSNLKKSVAASEAAARAAQKKVSAANANPPSESADPSANPYVRVVGRKVSATVPVGNALVWGGWQSSTGRMGFAIAIPTLDPTGSGVVQVATKWIEMSDAWLGISDDQAIKVELETLLRASREQATLTPDQLAALLKALEQSQGIDLLSAPIITVSSGRAASIAVTETRSTPNGPVEFGPVMNLTPTISADASSVDLALDAKLTLPKEQAE